MKAGSFSISGKIGGGFMASATIDGEKVKADIPKEYMTGVASFDNKEFRNKVKQMLIDHAKGGSKGAGDGDFTHSHSSNGVISYKHKSGAIVTVGGSNSDVIEHAGKGLGIMTTAKVGSGYTLP